MNENLRKNYRVNEAIRRLKEDAQESLSSKDRFYAMGSIIPYISAYVRIRDSELDCGNLTPQQIELYNKEVSEITRKVEGGAI
jgi:hypothetical protein